MPGILPRLTESGRRGMMIAAVVVGLGGAALAAWRHEYPAALLMLVTLTLLGGAYLWSQGSRDDESDGDGPTDD
jgi:hypothetical protein